MPLISIHFTATATVRRPDANRSKSTTNRYVHDMWWPPTLSADGDTSRVALTARLWYGNTEQYSYIYLLISTQLYW